jgi:hypothetical protein
MQRLILITVLFTILLLPFCTTSKKAVGDNKMTEPKISYALDIAPILADRCAPCHFPGGKKKFLDTYTAVSTQIDDILYRIQLPTDSSAFMPFKSKKPPLSDSLIQVIKLWKTQQMPN